MARVESNPVIEAKAVTVRCPTCGAAPGTRCELAIGGVRKQSHLDRRLIAADKLRKRPRA
jgi:hypothetical protein